MIDRLSEALGNAFNSGIDEIAIRRNVGMHIIMLRATGNIEREGWIAYNRAISYRQLTESRLSASECIAMEIDKMACYFRDYHTKPAKESDK